jgi:energy-coupling factor transporter ATP-binding protein EcfA2
VDDVSFDVHHGEIFGLIGPNGAGKTTTMECIEGLRTPDRGTISVLGPQSFHGRRRAAGARRRAAPGSAAAEANQSVGGGRSLGILLYPMIAVSGLFLPVAALPSGLRWLARILPITYAASLLQGIWTNEAWSGHLGDVAALAAAFAVCTATAAKVFRWE